MSACDCFACTATDAEFAARMNARMGLSRTDPAALLAATRADLRAYAEGNRTGDGE